MASLFDTRSLSVELWLLAGLVSCASTGLDRTGRTPNSTATALQTVEGVTDEDDQQVACRFAPVVLHARTNYSEPLHLLFDVSQTATHVFITYTIARASARPPSMLESAEVFVVLRKDSEARLLPVLAQTHARGRSFDYFSADPGSIVDGELLTSASRSSIFFEDSPIVQVSPREYGLIGVGLTDLFQLPASGPKSDLVSTVRCADDRVKQFFRERAYKVRELDLLPVAEVYLNVKNTSEFAAATPVAAARLPARTIVLEGKNHLTPRYPVSLEPSVYLSLYAPKVLKRLKSERGPAGLRQLNVAAPFHFSVGCRTDGTFESTRVDPATYFQSLYPATWSLQNGSKGYTRFNTARDLEAEWP